MDGGGCTSQGARDEDPRIMVKGCRRRTLILVSIDGYTAFHRSETTQRP